MLRHLIKEKFKRRRKNLYRVFSKDKVAVKSGYYFEIFDKSDIPNTLVKYNDKKVQLEDVVYDLYHGTSIKDEKKIDEMFGNRMGHYIDDYIIKKPKCALIGQNGNIFNLMSIASKTLEKNNMREEAKEMCSKIMQSHSYEKALSILGEYVDICSESELEEQEYEDG